MHSDPISTVKWVTVGAGGTVALRLFVHFQGTPTTAHEPLADEKGHDVVKHREDIFGFRHDEIQSFDSETRLFGGVVRELVAENRHSAKISRRPVFECAARRRQDWLAECPVRCSQRHPLPGNDMDGLLGIEGAPDQQVDLGIA